MASLNLKKMGPPKFNNFIHKANLILGYFWKLLNSYQILPVISTHEKTIFGLRVNLDIHRNLSQKFHWVNFLKFPTQEIISQN